MDMAIIGIYSSSYPFLPSESLIFFREEGPLVSTSGGREKADKKKVESVQIDNHGYMAIYWNI